jgi:predicted nucleic acid-binding protein
MIILDTNVISEMIAVAPSVAVEAWLSIQPGETVFTTTITQAELLYGLRRLPPGRRRSELEAAILPILLQDFAGRILPFDSAAADAFATIAAARGKAGRPIAQSDAQIAAIAVSRGAALATRNVDDFLDVGAVVIDPWKHDGL